MEHLTEKFRNKENFRNPKKVDVLLVITPDIESELDEEIQIQTTLGTKAANQLYKKIVKLIKDQQTQETENG